MMRVFNMIDSFLFNIAKLSIFICMFLITMNAAARYLFNKPITGAYEFTEFYLMVIMVFLSLSYTWKCKGFIAITVFSSKFPIKIKNIVYLIILISGIAFFSLIGYEAFATTFVSFMNKQVASGLIPWPMYLSTIWIPLGCAMIVLRMVIEMCFGMKNLISDGFQTNIFAKVNNDEDIQM